MGVFWLRVLVFGLGTAGASKAAFHQWQVDYGIAPYSTPEESDLRYALWLDQVTLYGKAALSPFTDRTLEEYREAFPLRTSEALRSDDFPAFPFKRFSRSYVQESLVAGVDWRARGAVTPCKSQGAQGDCGTFGQTQEAESQYFLGGGGRDPDKDKRSKPLTQFSEQQLMSCKGAHEDAYVFFRVGLEATSSYPYNATSWPTNDPPPCHFDATKVLPESIFSNWTTVPNDAGEDQLAAFVRHNGPVQIGIDAGVFKFADDEHHVTADKCGNSTTQTIDHSLGIVGFNTSKAKGPMPLVRVSFDRTRDRSSLHR